jgi:hypothetical protein
MFTNKLRKAPTSPSTPSSPRKSQSSTNTLQSSPRKNAVSSAVPIASLSPCKPAAKTVMIAPPKPPTQVSGPLRPQNPAEQYWAVRALKAETLLSARMAHHHELRSLSFSEETKRSVSTMSCRVRMQPDGLLVSLLRPA